MIEIIPNWHPMFVHFSVALLATSVVLFVLTKLATHWRLEDQWLAAAYWNLWLGTLITVGTVTAGFLAFNSVKYDDLAYVAMLEHRLWALATAGTFLVLAVWGVIQYRAQQRPHLVFVIAMVVGGILLLSAAWHGDELVYRHGLGVKSLPNLEQHSQGGAGLGQDPGMPADPLEPAASPTSQSDANMGTGPANVPEVVPPAAVGSEGSLSTPEVTSAPIGGEGTTSVPPSQ